MGRGIAVECGISLVGGTWSGTWHGIRAESEKLDDGGAWRVVSAVMIRWRGGSGDGRGKMDGVSAA